MNKPIDVSGHVFGKLTVIGRAINDPRPGWRWLCACECGNKVTVTGGNLVTDRTKSCGCLKGIRAGNLRRTHGRSKTPEYAIWTTMIDRCENAQNKNYERYGGRGIRMCDSWRNDFTNFYNDIGPRPSPKHTVERINNDGPYSAENCKWATRREQGNNTARNRFVLFRGQTKSISQWGRELSIEPSTLRCRLNSGMSVEEALTKPLWARRVQ